MRHCVKAVKPDAIVHLGDFYEDGTAIAEENPHIPVHQVVGNCDLYRCVLHGHQILTYSVGGVRMYMTHGHVQNVKSGLDTLLADARRAEARMVLFGHTHTPYCKQEADGMWVMNPGSCRSYGGSAGVVVTGDGEVTACYLINKEDLL